MKIQLKGLQNPKQIPLPGRYLSDQAIKRGKVVMENYQSLNLAFEALTGETINFLGYDIPHKFIAGRTATGKVLRGGSDLHDALNSGMDGEYELRQIL